MKAGDLDKKFDSGEDITYFGDISKARRVNQEVKRVNIDFPVWVVDRLDKHSKKLGISRQALVKIWVAEKIEETT